MEIVTGAQQFFMQKLALFSSMKIPWAQKGTMKIVGARTKINPLDQRAFRGSLSL